MGIIKGFLFLILIVTLAGAGLYVAVNRGYIQGETVQAFYQDRVAPLVGDSSQQLAILSERFTKVSSGSGEVLGAVVQVNENEKAAPHEKALNYGMYLYCQQVVQTFESQPK